MKLLRVIATLDPRHGGPAAGLRAITPELAALGHVSEFVCLDAPGQVREFPGAAAIHALGPARGGYAYARALEPWLRAHAGAYDAVFVHGLWQHHGRAVHRALRRRRPPYFVFPHGMLDPWFRRAYPLKHAKKWAYWQLCERHVLRDAAAVLFTCEEERRLARESFRPYACRERVVAYGTAAPPADAAAQVRAWREMQPALAARPFWLFLGRIHPKKGVDLLLRSYGELARIAGAELPALVIAGPCFDPIYLTNLRNLAAALPAPARVFWPGMLEGATKWGALRTAEAFVLPSHQENFGIAVVEALAAGTPVLISREVNIWREIESAGAGFADTDDAAGTRRLLARWHELPRAARGPMRSAAVELFTTRYEIGRAARSLVETITPFVRPVPTISLT
ncbi:glycosyltransferase [Opitutus terrae]|uniref:Glycosyl transferase group 1 n=1 Tax=Opitutus terrae (strain DSM 11246 / JCM 15787 / PB90-1) TaxID=452637 RepID=B1ZT84_OPITP|nr:glycosyltransferase [Opitutus terrae]ACB76538.1 glycosyl transferase group 1 [Opitutus terrae PB90-1]